MRNRKFLVETAENLVFYLMTMEKLKMKNDAGYWLNSVFESSANHQDEKSKISIEKENCKKNI